MSPLAWFILGWICASAFIALAQWLHWLWLHAQQEPALDFPDTTGFLAEYKPTRRMRAGPPPLRDLRAREGLLP